MYYISLGAERSHNLTYVTSLHGRQMENYRALNPRHHQLEEALLFYVLLSKKNTAN